MRVCYSLILIIGLSTAAQATYSIGSTPPDFTCSTSLGGTWNLYDQHGKVVLLNFGATW